MLALQGSLLDAGEPARVHDCSAAQRTVLAGGAWVEVRRAWMAGSGSLMQELVAEVPWQAERRRMYDRVVDVPRLVSFYGLHARLPSPVLHAARAALDRCYRAELGEGFATVGLCLYRDGRDSVAWHGDRIGRGAREDTVVAIVSLGATRPLLLRPRGGGQSIRFELAGGDLLVMGGSCQRTWEHSIPKSARGSGPRISVQYRAAGVR